MVCDPVSLLATKATSITGAKAPGPISSTAAAATTGLGASHTEVKGAREYTGSRQASPLRVKLSAMAKNIAIIDDNKLLRVMLTDVLSDAGFSVVSYATAEQALEGLWSHPVDAVVTDLYLPQMNGFDLVRELRTRAWASGLPCIAISAVDWPREQVEAFVAASPSMLMRKPFDAHRLIESIETMLRQQHGPAKDRVIDATPHAGALAKLELTNDDQRGAERTPVRLAVKLKSAAEVVIEYSENLSHSGIFVRTQEPLPLDTHVELELTLPYREGPVALEGTVVRSISPSSAQARTNGAGMAIALTGVPPNIRSELGAFLSGFREGLTQQSSNERRLLLVGLHSHLTRDVKVFLARSNLRVVKAQGFHDGAQLAATWKPHFVLVASSLVVNQARAATQLLGVPVERVGVYGLNRADVPNEVLHAATEQELVQMLSRSLDLPLRAHPRKTVRLLASVRRVDGEVKARAIDLSLGGLGFLAPAPCAVGERVELEVNLPGGFGTMKATARVVRASCEAPRIFRIGTSFITLSGDSTETLMRFLNPLAR